MDAYTLKKKTNTDEFHLFKGEMTKDACTSIRVSICEKMNKSESSGNKFACYNEVKAREKCAEIGRAVCGICVSHLYATYE